MILALFALPLAVAVLLLPLRRYRYICALLAAGALVVLVAALTARTETSAWLLFGRAFNLPPFESMVLAACFGLLALALLYSNWVPQGEQVYATTLGIAALFVAATALRNIALATLLLEAGIIASAMLVPSERPGAALGGMRVLVLLALACPLLLVGAWALESYAGEPERVQLLQTAVVSLAIGYGIALGVVPFHTWVPAMYQHGRVLAVVMLHVVVPAMLLLHMGNLSQAAAWPGEQSFTLGLMLAAGVVTAIAGNLMALTQRTVGRALGYAALADLGIVLLGLGLGTSESARAALIHMGYRGVAVITAAMGVGVLQRVLGGDSLDDLRGAFRRAPLAMLGVMVGGLALAGMPLTAGFTSRLTIYGLLAAERPQLGLLLVASSFGPAWAVARYALAAWVSTPSVESRERLAPGLLIALLSLALLAVGIWPDLVQTLAGPWLQTMLGHVLWQ